LDEHPFSGQCFADAPAAILDVDGSLAVNLERPCAFRILPWRRARIIAAQAGLSHLGRCLRLERFMGANVIVFQPVGIQPGLRLATDPAVVQRPLQTAVESLHFARKRLRMAVWTRLMAGGHS